MRLSYYIFIVLIYLSSIQNAFSQIKHISLNERLFELGKLPVIQVNIVADEYDISNLEFILVQNEGKERLIVQRKNQFMLLAMGLEEVTDINAKLIVRYSTPIRDISLFNKKDVKKTESSLSNHSLSSNKSSLYIQNVQPCTLEYSGNKTLWSLGQEYSSKWETNVYTAILAIYYANSSAFSQRKINALRKEAKLNCPTEELLNQYGDLELAKKRYNSMN